jgi:hypothetical protein
MYKSFSSSYIYFSVMGNHLEPPRGQFKRLKKQETCGRFYRTKKKKQVKKYFLGGF